MAFPTLLLVERPVVDTEALVEIGSECVCVVVYVVPFVVSVQSVVYVL